MQYGSKSLNIPGWKISGVDFYDLVAAKKLDGSGAFDGVGR